MILNFFNFRMFLSTCERNDATRRVWVVPLANSRGPLQYAGINDISYIVANQQYSSVPVLVTTPCDRLVLKGCLAFEFNKQFKTVNYYPDILNPLNLFGRDFITPGLEGHGTKNDNSSDKNVIQVL